MIMPYRALHVLVPLALVAVVLSVVGAGDVLSRLRSAEPGWILAALGACSAQTVLSALRWRLTAERLGASMSIGDAVSEYYLSSLVNTTVPGGIVGDAVRAVRTRGAAGLERAAQAVMIERLAGQVAVGSVLLFGLAVSGRPELQWIAALVAAALGAGVCAVRGAQAERVLPPAVRRFLAAIRQSWFDRRAACGQVALSLLIVALNLAAFVLAARATGVALDPVDALLAVPLVLAAMLVPLSVAGWGYREGAAAAVFPLIGAGAAAGVSASVAFGAVVLVASLPGLGVLLLRKGARTGAGTA
jgi:uncharacterized membrane protein YbhN (UPF0104 family)